MSTAYASPRFEQDAHPFRASILCCWARRVGADPFLWPFGRVDFSHYFGDVWNTCLRCVCQMMDNVDGDGDGGEEFE